jgi:hypothetical protein
MTAWGSRWSRTSHRSRPSKRIASTSTTRTARRRHLDGRFDGLRRRQQARERHQRMLPVQRQGRLLGRDGERLREPRVRAVPAVDVQPRASSTRSSFRSDETEAQAGGTMPTLSRSGNTPDTDADLVLAHGGFKVTPPRVQRVQQPAASRHERDVQKSVEPAHVAEGLEPPDCREQRAAARVGRSHALDGRHDRHDRRLARERL